MNYFEDIFILFVFGVPVYYVCRWVFKKFINDKTKLLITTLVSTVIITPLMLWGLVTLFFMYLSYYPKINFNREKWLGEPDKRYQMTESIIQSKMLIGKTKEEVKVLLGDGQGFGGDKATYYIGFTPGGFSIDPDMLDIQFKNGKVVKVKQIYD